MWPNVYASAAPTPNGAKYITIFVKKNITCVRDLQKLRMGARLGSGTSDNAIPKSTANTATCKICPSAMDFARFSGKTWTRNLSQDIGAATGGADDTAVCGGTSPSPARLISM